MVYNIAATCGGDGAKVLAKDLQWILHQPARTVSYGVDSAKAVAGRLSYQLLRYEIFYLKDIFCDLIIITIAC